MENFLILRIHLNSLMNKSDTGHNYRWAKIMKKFHLLIFKYIKLNSKWGFLILLPNHESLWVIRTYPSTLRLGSTLIPFVLYELAFGYLWLKSACVTGKQIAHQLSTESFKHQAHLFLHLLRWRSSHPV